MTEHPLMIAQCNPVLIVILKEELLPAKPPFWCENNKDDIVYTYIYIYSIDVISTVITVMCDEVWSSTFSWNKHALDQLMRDFIGKSNIQHFSTFYLKFPTFANVLTKHHSNTLGILSHDELQVERCVNWTPSKHFG